MNVGHVEFELTEALMHLQALVTQFREDRVQPDASPGLAVELGHLLDHICFAWNGRDLLPEDFPVLPQEDYERMANTVPNFGATRIMGDTAC